MLKNSEIWICSEIKFRNICFLIGFSKYKTDFAWDALRLNMPEKELMEKYNYELATVQNKKYRIRKELNNCDRFI